MAAWDGWHGETQGLQEGGGETHRGAGLPGRGWQELAGRRASAVAPNPEPACQDRKQRRGEEEEEAGRDKAGQGDAQRESRRPPGIKAPEYEAGWTLRTGGRSWSICVASDMILCVLRDQSVVRRNLRAVWGPFSLL